MAWIDETGRDHNTRKTHGWMLEKRKEDGHLRDDQ
jgi:hypothetical protein